MLSSGQSVTGLPGTSSFADGDVSLKKVKGGGFQTMGLTKEELRSVLHMGFSVPTPIQRKAIPVLMQGNDVVGMARTGSGKTAAYLVPLIHRLKEHSKFVGIRGLILAPTRELSLQILREIGKLSKHTNFRTCALVGGNSLDDQFARLAENPDIVVATPGRLLHIMEEAKLALTAVQVVILDEADRLFELGLQPQIVAVLQKVPDDCQRALFSATMPSVLAEFTEARLHNPVIVRLDAESKLSDTLKQSAYFVRTAEKPAALIFMLRHVMGVDAKTSQALIFVESKYHVEFFVALLNEIEIPTTGVHGQMDQEARRVAVDRFARRQVCAMVVTDVAARGIDLPLLDNVINYSFPAVPKIFIHRVGRVARAGRSGAAYSILTYDDMPYYVDLMDFIGRPLQTTPSDDAEAGTDLLFTPDDGCYGRLPDADVQRNVDYVNHMIETHPELEAAFRIMEKAHGKYTRTKKKASGEGIREARNDTELRLENIPLHPIFALKQSQESKEHAKALQALRTFKSNETYLDMVYGSRLFEIKAKPSLQTLRKAHEDAKSAPAPNPEEDAPVVKRGMKRGIAQTAPSPPTMPTGGAKITLAERLLMRGQEKRARAEQQVLTGEQHEARLLSGDTGGDAFVDATAVRRGLAHDANDKYRDREFFMPTVREEQHQDQHYSVRDVAVDFTADTAEDAAKQRKVFAWNKRKNKFIKTNVNEAKALLLGIKNEAGKAIDFKTKLDAYNRWTRTSNLRIQDVGEEEDAAAMARARALNKHATAELDENDEDYADISDPLAGKKLRIGKKLRKMPKDGKTLNFEELHTMKEKKKKEHSKLEARRAKKAGGGKHRK